MYQKFIKAGFFMQNGSLCGAVSNCMNCGLCFTEDYQLPSNAKEDIIKNVVKKIVEKIVAETDIDITDNKVEVTLGVSVRHIHIKDEDLKKLFGANSKLEVMRMLRQPGEFASNLTCTVEGPKGQTIPNIRILGPCRNFTQVELSNTDAINLGLKIPVRNSGDVKNSAPVKLIGPKGSINLSEGAIRAQRHIHFDLKGAAFYGLKDGDYVKVRVPGDAPVIFENVLIRVKDSFLPEFHIDTDEANAVGIKCGTEIEIIK